jgi:nicotinamidase-related amidase
MLTLLVGEEGLGKSTLLARLIADLTRGRLDGDLGERTGDVLYLTGEDAPDSVIVPRLQAAGAACERVHFIDLREADGEPRWTDLGRDLGLIAEAVEACRAALVVIDPVADFLGGRNTNHEHVMRQSLGPVARLAADAGVAVIATRHVNRQSTSDPLTRAMGSRVFTQLARSMLLFGCDPGDPAGRAGSRRVLGVGKANHAAPGTQSLAYRLEGATVLDDDGREIETVQLVEAGPSAVGASEILVPVDRPRAPLRATAVALVHEQLGHGEWLASGPLRDAADALGISDRTLNDALKEAGAEYRGVGYPRHTEWRLPVTRRRSSEEGHPSSSQSVAGRPRLVAVPEPPEAETEDGAAETELATNDELAYIDYLRDKWPELDLPRA